MDLLPITIIDVSRGLQRAVVPVASSLLSRIVVPFSLVSSWGNGERTDDLAQTLVDHGTSFCVEPQRPCPRSLGKLKVSRPATWQAFQLTAIDDRPGAEAAKVLGMHVAHVFVAKHRVHKMLEEELRLLKGKLE